MAMLDRRSSAGLRAVLTSLFILGAATVIQAVIFVATGSAALLSDLIHNGGDALTAVPLGIAFVLNSETAERYSGLAVVFAIFVSACGAAYEAAVRLIRVKPPDHLLALALGAIIGAVGNYAAAKVRGRAGQELNSAALVADADHARADALVSLGVVASAILVAARFAIADPIIGILIALSILHVTWDAWRTVHQPGSACVIGATPRLRRAETQECKPSRG